MAWISTSRIYANMAFHPKLPQVPLFVECISRSRFFSAFYVELGVSIVAASTIMSPGMILLFLLCKIAGLKQRYHYKIAPSLTFILALIAGSLIAQHILVDNLHVQNLLRLIPFTDIKSQTIIIVAIPMSETIHSNTMEVAPFTDVSSGTASTLVIKASGRNTSIPI